MGTLALVSCEKPITQDPVSALNGLMGEYGFIGYENPLENSGTGVMLAGRPTALAYVAPADDCFNPEAIPREYDRQHFDMKKTYNFHGDLGFTVFGSALFGAGFGLTNKHIVEVELNGLTIEYMSSIDVTHWYRNGMDDVCKDYLDDVGFVIQAAMVDSMKIKISNLKGTNLSLNADNISQYIGINLGVEYSFLDEYTLEITTPKYVGYQLGRLRLEDEGRTLYRAMVAEDDQFIFEPIGLFQDEEAVDIEKALIPSELDQNSVYLR
tara:strand:- start:30849 stop:31649 length:801 start_codon:yes stop_codon:yes gene_type:complete